jgi:hypothetical protein
VGPSQVHEEVDIACTPDGPAVDQLLVQFSVPRDAPPEWSLGPGTRQPPRARRLTPAELAERGFPTGGETWLLELPQRYSEPFEIRAYRSVPAEPQFAVNLVAVPTASEQTGLVRLTLAGTAQWAIDCRRLRPVPDDLHDTRASNPPAVVYRYVPSRDAAPLIADDPPLRLVQTAAQASDGVVWSAVLHTWLAATGTADHVAEYRLQWARPGTLRLALPRDAQLVRLRVNGQQVPARFDGGDVLVALPGDQRHPVVQIGFRTAWPSAAWMASVVLPLPEPDLPVLQRVAHVWAPPDCDVRSAATLWEHTTTGLADWKHRLGGLLRTTAPQPLNPLARLGWCWTPEVRAAKAAAETTAHEALHALSQAMRGEAAGQISGLVPTWRSALQQAAATLQLRDVRLLLDADALAQRGLRPVSPLDAQVRGEPHPDRWLARHGLALLVRGRVVVLTSDLRVAALGAELAPLSVPQSYAAVSGPAAQLLEQLQLPTPAGAASSGQTAGDDAAEIATIDLPTRLVVADTAVSGNPSPGENSSSNTSSGSNSTGNTATIGGAAGNGAPHDREADNRQAGNSPPGNATARHAAPLHTLETSPDGPAPALDLVAPEQWPDRLADPWSYAGGGGMFPAWPGWGRHVFRSAGHEPLPVLSVARRDVLRSLGLAVMVLAAAIAAWLWRRQRVAYAVVLAALVAVSLLIPDVLLETTARSVPGFLLGTLGGLLWPSGVGASGRRAARDVARHSTGSARASGAMGMLLLAGACCGAWCGWRSLAAQETVHAATASDAADEPAADPLPAPGPVHKVFVPVDEQRRPVDGFYWVAEPLWEEMQRRAAVLTREPRDYLLAAPRYIVRLADDSGGAAMAPVEVRAVYELRVFGGPRRVQLALASKAGGPPPLRPATVEVDGVPVPSLWTAEGLLTFDLPGGQSRYLLSLTFHPDVLAYDGRRGFDLPIPVLPTSALELLLPDEATDVDVLTARGRIGATPVGLKREAALGPSRLLSLRWGNSMGGTSRFMVDQLHWLKIQPGSVRLDAQFRIDVAQASVERLYLSADSRLRLPRFVGDTVRRVRVVAPSDLNALGLGSDHAELRQVFEVELARPLQQSGVLEATFPLEDSSGVGQMRMPVVEVLQADSVRQWWAYSVDSSLDYREIEVPESSPLTAAEWTALWGPTDTTAAAARRVASADANWTFATFPRLPQLDVAEATTWVLGTRRAELIYRADLRHSGSAAFRYWLRVPPEVQVEQILVEEDNVPRPLHWTRAADGVTVFLADAAAARQELVLRGHLPLPLRGTRRLPVVECDSARPRRAWMWIFHDGTVRVDFPQAQPQADDPAATGETAAARALLPEAADLADARSLGFFALSQLDAAQRRRLLVRFAPDIPRLTARQVLRLDKSARGYFVQMDYYVDVLEGTVDRLRFEIPRYVGPPIEVHPPADVQLIDLPESSQRHLQLRLHREWTGSERITLRAALQWPAHEAPHVPDIQPRLPGRTVRTVLLPRRIEGADVTWETFGLAPAEQIPQESEPLPEDHDAYRVVSASFQARLQYNQPQVRNGSVRFMDVRVQADGSGRWWGTSTLDLLPGGRHVCRLYVPPHVELLAATVNGEPALRAAADLPPALVAPPVSPADVPGRGDLAPQEHRSDESPAARESLSSAPGETENATGRQYELVLTSDRLPQFVELLFRSRPSASGGFDVDVPRPLDVTVDETAWTVLAPSGWRVVPDRPDGIISSWQWHALRLEALHDVLALGNLVAGDSPASGWLLPWMPRLDEELMGARRTAAGVAWRSAEGVPSSEGSSSPAQRDAQTAAAELQALRDEWVPPFPETWPLAARSRLIPTAWVAEAAGVLPDRRGPQPETWRLQFAGLQHAVAIAPGDPPESPWTETVLSVLVAGTLGVAVGWIASRRGPFYRRFGMAVWLAIGLLWWCFLAPSGLGPALALAGSAAVLRQRWAAAGGDAPRNADASASRGSPPRSTTRAS